MAGEAINVAIAILIVGFLVYAHHSISKFFERKYPRPVEPKPPVVHEATISEILGKEIKEPSEHSKDDPTLEDELARFVNNE
tara:strand:+ start:914 stop:1159 length:246 start_codon:yes stop_codon:yes gene_type:complete